MSKQNRLSRLFSLKRGVTTLVKDSIDDPRDARFRIRKAVFAPGRSKLWMKSPGFESPEVDFEALRNAGHTEPLFRRRANRYQNLVWKNGYDLKTDDDKAKGYIKARMDIFTLLSGETFNSFMRKVSRELIQFDNCLIWERRVPTAELKKIGIKLPMRGVGEQAKRGPVVMYEVLPIDTIEYKRDEFGNILKWRQRSDTGSYKEFAPRDVILLKNDEESGDILAYPSLAMALPDARILRQLETDASLVAHRLAFPIFKYRVGDPKVIETLPRKTDSLDDIWYTLEGMLLEGALIIPGSDDFSVVLSDVKADGLQSILDYFKNRVIIGLGLSPIHIGEVGTANRSLADRLDVQLYDDTKAFQKTLSETFTYFIFFKWLMEGGFNLDFGVDGESPSRVFLSFREIDTDSLIKRQNHLLQLWVQDAITHDELRSGLGYTPTTDLSRFYSSLIGEINAQFDNSADQSAAQATSGGAGQDSHAKTRAKKTSSITFSNEMSGVIETLWGDLRNEMIDHSSKNDLSESAKAIKDSMKISTLELEDVLRVQVSKNVDIGMSQALQELNQPSFQKFAITSPYKDVDNIVSSIKIHIESFVDEAISRANKNIKSNNTSDTASIDIALTALRGRFDSIFQTYLQNSQNLGVCLTALHNNNTYVYLDGASENKLPTWEVLKELIPPLGRYPIYRCQINTTSKDVP